MKKVIPYVFFICIGIALLTGVSSATTPPPGEEALFTTSASPDTLIVLDLSGSMEWNPAAGSNYWGNSSCTGTFYSSSGTGHDVKCRRIDIAKRAIFDILDDTDNNTIDSQDEGSLGVRIGYMRFYNGDDTGGDYSSGNNKLIRAIGSKYSVFYCAFNSCCSFTSGSGSSNCVNGESAGGGTPISSALNEAKLYLDAHKAGDSAKNCRQKFVILLSDGADTYACGGNGAECQQTQYKRRREAVAKAKALADAGYRVFVVGFGSSMPKYLQNTLNWMAYYGGTDNPNQTNSGDTSAYNPANVTSCQTDTSFRNGSCCDPTCSSETNFYATANDPGDLDNNESNNDLVGYAFLAGDADQLATALKTAINLIREAIYSFSQSSVQSSRTQDENFIYEGSFQPVAGDPFWRGHLKKYQLNDDGTVGSALWDAGDVLQVASASGRTMKTYKAGTLTDFTTSNITAGDLGVTTTVERDAIVGYIRGESSYNPDSTAAGVFKLGDVFRSTPITVGTPTVFFDDMRDENNAFATHRTDHPRSSENGKRLIVAGANDGQMHGFRTSNGTEAWSFIPPNLLSKLKNIAHSSHPTSLTHQYFVDGPVTVADVWLGTGDGTSKNASDWKTIMAFGEGRGSTPNLWSSSSSCDSGLNATYTSSYPYYCGFYAFDLNDSLNPVFKWLLSADSSQAPYLGDPWSKIMTGRVRYKSGGAEVEKWVGFIGAGYNAADCSGGGGCDPRGKGIFVVDLTNGQILWSYTRANDSEMNYSISAPPAIVDTDNDGFVDTAYIGDMGGSMWRLKFCRAEDTSCTISDWTGGRLFASSTGTIRPIYTMPAVAQGSLWVYWGTGDKTDPTAPNAQEKFFGLKDNDRTTQYSISNLDNITSGTYSSTSTKAGYYINLAGGGEKVLADPTVFGGVVYFTTYTPPSGSDPCEQGGVAKLYAINYTSGGGASGVLPDDARSMEIGSGISSAPVISLKPAGSAIPDLYVTVSGGGGTGASTARININPPGLSNRANLLYWRDRRLR